MKDVKANSNLNSNDTTTETDTWQIQSRFKKVAVLLNPRLHAGAQAAARREGQSFSAWVRQAIERELERMGVQG